jgi:hypothetical protein
MIWFLIPIALQALAMVFDELYFHRKRGLPRWERIGHPLDTFTVIISYAVLVFLVPTAFNLKLYIGLCAFSCLFITKDEFVHTENCEASENWLHAVLFVLHPITFLAAGMIWWDQLNPLFLKMQLLILIIVMIYQVLYWRIPFGKSK